MAANTAAGGASQGVPMEQSTSPPVSAKRRVAWALSASSRS